MSVSQKIRSIVDRPSSSPELPSLNEGPSRMELSKVPHGQGGDPGAENRPLRGIVRGPSLDGLPRMPSPREGARMPLFFPQRTN